MELGLNGRRVLVTGRTSGLGSATALVLAREGAIVVVHGRNRERAENVVAEIKACGGRALLALGDLANDAGADSVAEVIFRALGGVDVLVNNAGGKDSGSENESWMTIDSATWTRTYEMNVVAASRMIRKFVPGMRKMRTDIGMQWLMNVAQQQGWGGDPQVAEQRFCNEMMPNALGRIGAAEDIGNAVAFLASDLAGYITGCHLRVDGGLSRSVN